MNAGMVNFTEVAPVVRALTEFFAEYDLQEAEKTLAVITVCDQLNLTEFKNELLEQPAVDRMVQRFRINPFDMENVFDLEDELRKATQRHRLFALEGADVESTAVESSDISSGAVSVQEQPLPEKDFIQPVRGSNNQQTLMCYMQWANQVFYQFCTELSADELSATRPMLFDSILHLLNHVYAMQLVWQAHLLDKPHGFTSRRPAETDVLDFATLRSQQIELDAWYVDYAGGLSVAQQAESVSFEFIDGCNGVMTRAEILQHVANHASYHRGHIEGVFHQLGVGPPTTDMPVFLRLCT